jgi:predicted ATPase
MFIKRIRIDGFKNVIDTTIEFNNSISALLGLNNYGKSNFLEGIDFAKEFINNQPRTKTRMMKDTSSLPINIKTAERDLLFEIEFSSAFEEKLVKYSFSFEWIKNGGKGARIKSELLQIKNKETNKFQTCFKRNENESFYKSSLTGRVDTKIVVKENELVLNSLTLNKDLFYSNILEEINNTSFSFNSLLDTDSAFSSINISNDEDDLSYHFDSMDGSNISKVIYNLHEHYPDKFELLINSLKSLIPSIEIVEPVALDFKSQTKFDSNNVPFKIPEKMYDIRVKEKFNNQSSSIKGLSTGTKRLVLLLTTIILADIKNISLILLEELENSIHPHLFQRLLITLTDICDNCKILISSHSPYLVNYLDLENIYVAVPSQFGTAQFKTVKKSMHKRLYKNARESGMTIGDCLFDMLIESVDDESNFCSYFEC